MLFLPAQTAAIRTNLFPHIPRVRRVMDSSGGLSIKLHPGQNTVFRSPRRYRTVVAGRRWGKSTLCVVELICAAAKPRQNCMYVAPSHAMARQIVWDALKESIPDSWLAKKPNETNLEIRLKNGSKIMLRGSDNPDSLRGIKLHFLVMDEFQDFKPDTYSKVLRATLSDTNGRLLTIGTPKGYANIYELYQNGISRDDGKPRKKGWASWQFKTADSPFVPDEEIESARNDLDPHSFSQEYEANFLAMGGRVYYDFSRDHNVRPCPYDPSLPTLIGQDFNIDPMSTVLIQLHGEEVWVTGELSLRSSSTEDVCRELVREFGWDFRDKATVYPDPAGNTRQHARGESDIQIFREWGFNRILFRRKHPSVRDRIAAVNRLICDASGRRRLFIDPSCKHLIESLEKLLYKEGTNEPDKDLNIEHMGDALGYPCEYEFPVKRRSHAIGYSH